MIKRTQNRIAESRWALPICAAYTLLICIISGLFVEGIWVQLALTAVATLLMVELNNRNSLIRIYSRMVSCSFLVLTMMTPHKMHRQRVFRGFLPCFVSCLSRQEGNRICTLGIYRHWHSKHSMDTDIVVCTCAMGSYWNQHPCSKHAHFRCLNNGNTTSLLVYLCLLHLHGRHHSISKSRSSNSRVWTTFRILQL